MQEDKRKKIWKFVAEALAWAAVAGFLMLLFQPQLVGIGLGLLVVFVPLGAAAAYLRGILLSQERRFKNIEAEAFIVKRDGIVLAKLGADEHSPVPSLELFNKWESLAARFGWERESHEIALSIYDWSGKERSRLSCPSFIIRDSDARQRLQLMENAVTMRDANGNDLLSISLDENDPQIRLFGADHTEKLHFGLVDGEPQVTLSGGQDGNHRIRLALDDDLPSISLRDSDGKERVVLDLLEDLNLRVHDPEGKVIWSAP